MYFTLAFLALALVACVVLPGCAPSCGVHLNKPCWGRDNINTVP